MENKKFDLKMNSEENYKVIAGVGNALNKIDNSIDNVLSFIHNNGFEKHIKLEDMKALKGFKTVRKYNNLFLYKYSLFAKQSAKGKVGQKKVEILNKDMEEIKIAIKLGAKKTVIAKKYKISVKTLGRYIKAYDEKIKEEFEKSLKQGELITEDMVKLNPSVNISDYVEKEISITDYEELGNNLYKEIITSDIIEEDKDSKKVKVTSKMNCFDF